MFIEYPTGCVRKGRVVYEWFVGYEMSNGNTNRWLTSLAGVFLKFEIQPSIYVVMSIYLDEVEMLDDVESEDDVDAELELDTLKWQ